MYLRESTTILDEASNITTNSQNEKNKIKITLRKRWKETIEVALNFESIKKNLKTLINTMTIDIVTTKQNKEL